MTNPLIVPVEIEVYLVNSRMVAQEHVAYGRWRLDFSAPEDINTPPEPYPFSGSGYDAPTLGAHVHWLLPDAFRTQRDTDGLFPPVPNRWLVVRSSRPPGNSQAVPVFKAWVVESDFLADEQQDDPYPWKGNYSPWLHKATKESRATHDRMSDHRSMRIGRAWELENWQDSRSNGGRLFLTATGPGIMAFCGYQPYNTGVFSFYDDLHDIADPPRKTLDYLVVGWFSPQNEDILADSSDLTGLIEELGWTTSGKPDATSFYAGAALCLEWDNTSDALPLDGNRPDSLDEVFLAVGHNTADAQTAPGLHHTKDVATERLFQAFLTGRFEQLDQNPRAFDDTTHSSWFTPSNTDHAWQITDPPSGQPRPPDELKDELKKERAWLADLNARQYRYNLLARHATGLRFRLYELWRLNITPQVDSLNPAGRPPNFRDHCQKKIGDLTGSLHAILTEMDGIIRDQTVNNIADIPGLPHGSTEAEFADSIAKYAAAWGIDPECKDPNKVHRVLKPVALPGFQVPNEPVVLLGGLWKDPKKKPVKRTGPLFCRTQDQLVAGIRIGDTTVSDSPARTPEGWDHLPPPTTDAFTALFTEFTLLSRAAATGDLGTDVKSLDPASHVSGLFRDSAGNPTGPGYFTAIRPLWEQAWSPVYLVWKMQYYPVPPVGCDGYQWSFNAENGRYRLTRTGEEPVPVTPLTLSGRCALTDVPAVLLGGGFERHARTYADAPLQALRELIDKLDEFGQISQTVEGLHRSLLQRLSGIGITPPSDDLLSEYLVDFPYNGFPAPDPDDALNADGPTLRFHPAGGGQFVFTFAGVVDSMGRHLTLIDVSADGDSATLPEKHPPYRAASITPNLDDHNHYITFGDNPNADDGDTHVTDPDCYVQLAPRILQPTRLRFDFVSANDPYANGKLVPPTVIDDPPVVATWDNPPTTPVVGWLVANHLTGALLVHDQHGRGIVEGRKGIGVSGEDAVPAVDWATLPYYSDPNASDAYTDDPAEPDGDFARRCPELYQFIASLRSKGTDAFDTLMECIDAPTTAALPPATGNTMTASLIGQPVALLRARLTLETDTLPFTDPSWDKASDFPTPDYLAQRWKWNIRLGGPPRQDPDTQVMKTTDGLIGYFTHKTGAGDAVDPTTPTDYTVFRTALGPTNDYARQIDARDLALPINPVPALDPDAGFDPENPFTAFVTLLAHPWANINALTDILPAVTLRLPDKDVRTPLSHLRIASRTGPLLAGTRPVPTGTGDDQTNAVVMPCPSAWKGIWNWSEPQRPQQPPDRYTAASRDAQRAQSWDHYPITPADNVAHLDQAPPLARTGYLTLTTAVGQTSPQHKSKQSEEDTGHPEAGPSATA